MLPRGQAGVSPAADVSGNWPAADCWDTHRVPLRIQKRRLEDTWEINDASSNTCLGVLCFDHHRRSGGSPALQGRNRTCNRSDIREWQGTVPVHPGYRRGRKRGLFLVRKIPPFGKRRKPGNKWRDRLSADRWYAACIFELPSL